MDELGVEFTDEELANLGLSREEASEIGNMSESFEHNDWPKAKPREQQLTNNEIKEIKNYGKNRDINIQDSKRFDGDTSLLFKQIGVMADNIEQYTILKKHVDHIKSKQHNG